MVQPEEKSEKWPEHRRFFEAVGEVLGGYGSPEEIALDDGRVAAWHLADLSPLVQGEVVVIPKFVAGGRKAPSTTMTSWMSTLPAEVRVDYPGATGVLLTNSPIDVQGYTAFRVWDRDFLSERILRGDGGFDRLARFFVGRTRHEDVKFTPIVKVKPIVQIRVEPRGWLLAGDGEVFVLPLSREGWLRGGYTGEMVLREVDGIPDHFPQVSIDHPVAADHLEQLGNVLLATAYDERGKPDVVRAVKGLVDALERAPEIQVVYLPLMGASELGPQSALRELTRVWNGTHLSRPVRVVLVLQQMMIATSGGKDVGPAVAETQPVTMAAVAGFANDVAKGTDLLGMEEQAESFAQLLTSQKVKMPLAIGLFGNWGCGKSFFMNLIERGIDELRKRVDANDVHGHGNYFRGVTVISFNAWHYTDSDLWSCLALRIFDGVAAFMAGENKTEVDAETISMRQRLAREVASNERARSEAEQALAMAQEQRIKAQADLLAAEDDRKSAAKKLSFVDFSSEFVEAARPVLAAAGLPGAVASVQQAERALSDARHIGGVLAFMFPGLAFGAGKNLPLLLAVLSLGLVGLCHWLFRFFGGDIQGAMAALAPLALMGGDVVRRLGVVRKTVDELADLLAKVRENAAEPSAECKGMGDALNACDARIAAAMARLAQCDQAIIDASQRLHEVEAGALVYDFLRERAGDERYRSRLGVVSMLRQDLENLHSKLTALEGVRSNNTKASVVSVRRIVLLIDDLDRCEPDRVVDVLQAVHLLLAFPLFAVIVAVDPRWLERSLYKRYLPGFESMDGDARAASEFSPHNYLEKIFQIPYRVPEMSAQGFEALILSHAPAAEDVARGMMEGGANSENMKKNSSPSSPTPGNSPPIGGEGESDGAGMAQSRTWVKVPEFSLQPEERHFLSGLHAFAPTPRLAKRLINAYALLRLQVHMASDPGNPDRAWNAFLSGGFRGAALLLAMDVGFPIATRLLRHALIVKSEEAAVLLDAFVQQSPPASEVRRQCLSLAEALAGLPEIPPHEEMAGWLGIVGRFCFHEPCSLDELWEENAIRTMPTEMSV